MGCTILSLFFNIIHSTFDVHTGPLQRLFPPSPIMTLKYELRQSSMVLSILATLTLQSPPATTEYSNSCDAGHSQWLVSAFSFNVFHILRHFNLVRWKIWFPSKRREPLTLQHNIISRRHEYVLVFHQTIWCRGNSLAFLCGGSWLQSRTGHGMHRLRLFVAFISRSRQRKYIRFFTVTFFQCSLIGKEPWWFLFTKGVIGY